MRSVQKRYIYECDHQGYTFGCAEVVVVNSGDAIPDFPGAVQPHCTGIVASVDDADKVMQNRYGWKVTKFYHLCKKHRNPE
jgi:hypothetical protein